jgi:predicted AAA+ superfamily ATPase
MMQRTKLKKLVAWRNHPQRMPLLLDGARQVGKTYLLETLFGKRYFKHVVKLDFLESPDLCSIFEEVATAKGGRAVTGGLGL